MRGFESDLSPSNRLFRSLILCGFSTEESEACGPATGTEISLVTVIERESWMKAVGDSPGVSFDEVHTQNPEMHIGGPFALPQAPETDAFPSTGINDFIQCKFYYFHFRGERENALSVSLIL